MPPILQKYLHKLGIKDILDLKEDEKKDFDRWERILTEGNITVDKILDFCSAQVKIIETQFKNLDNTANKNERLILLHTIYNTLITLIKSPEAERENLEKYLNTLL